MHRTYFSHQPELPLAAWLVCVRVCTHMHSRTLNGVRAYVRVRACRHALVAGSPHQRALNVSAQAAMTGSAYPGVKTSMRMNDRDQIRTCTLMHPPLLELRSWIKTRSSDIGATSRAVFTLNASMTSNC